MIGAKTYLHCCLPLIVGNFISVRRLLLLSVFNRCQPLQSITVEFIREHNKKQGLNKGESNNMDEKTLLAFFITTVLMAL
jgi:hypothetical protein